MVDAQVVDPADRHPGRGALEAGHAVPRHAEAGDHVPYGAHGLVGRELEGGGEQVPVEDHVQVLVGGDAGQHPVADRVAGVVAGVAVRDPGRQLLEGDVRDRVQHAVRVVGLEARRHVRHPEVLQLDRVHGPAGEQVVPHDDAVPALLRRPAVHPGAPGTVPPEEGGDLVVVAGQVVLGQQVDHQGGPPYVTDLGLLGGPRFAAHDAVEVAAVAPGHVLVRHPVLGHLQVPVQLLLDDLFEGVQQPGVAPCGLAALFCMAVGGNGHGYSMGTGLPTAP